MCDMFQVLHDAQFTGYVDEHKPFAVRDNIPDVISVLEEIVEKLLSWFSYNKNKVNAISDEYARPELSEN